MIPPLSSKYIGVNMKYDFQFWVSGLECSIFEYDDSSLGSKDGQELVTELIMTQEQRTQLEILLKSFTEK